MAKIVGFSITGFLIALFAFEAVMKRLNQEVILYTEVANPALEPVFNSLRESHGLRFLAYEFSERGQLGNWVVNPPDDANPPEVVLTENPLTLAHLFANGFVESTQDIWALTLSSYGFVFLAGSELRTRKFTAIPNMNSVQFCFWDYRNDASIRLANGLEKFLGGKVATRIMTHLFNRTSVVVVDHSDILLNLEAGNCDMGIMTEDVYKAMVPPEDERFEFSSGTEGVTTSLWLAFTRHMSWSARPKLADALQDPKFYEGIAQATGTTTDTDFDLTTKHGQDLIRVYDRFDYDQITKVVKDSRPDAQH